MESIRFKQSGGRIDFGTRSTRSGLGEGFDLLGIFGNIGFDGSKMEIVACVQHAAKGVAPTLQKIVLRFLRGRYKHLRPVKMFGEKSLSDFRPEIAEINAKRIAARSLYIIKGLDHMNLALHNTYGALIDIICIELILVGIDQRLSANK